MSVKRDTEWTGYKVHLTETCDADLPHLVIHVETTEATKPDMELTGVIHQALDNKQLLPEEHFMDTGYVDGEHLATSEKRYGIELIGPVALNPSWQAKDPQAYDNSKFLINWENKTVTCPEGIKSKKWTVKQNEKGQEENWVRFGEIDCRNCPTRSLCTHSAVHPRQLVLRGIRSNMRQFKQQDIGKPQKSSKNDMLNVLVLKAPYRKGYELSTFVFHDTLVLRKHIFSMFSLLRP